MAADDARAQVAGTRANCPTSGRCVTEGPVARPNTTWQVIV